MDDGDRGHQSVHGHWLGWWRRDRCRGARHQRRGQPWCVVGGHDKDAIFQHDFAGGAIDVNLDRPRPFHRPASDYPSHRQRIADNHSGAVEHKQHDRSDHMASQRRGIRPIPGGLVSDLDYSRKYARFGLHLGAGFEW